MSTRDDLLAGLPGLTRYFEWSTKLIQTDTGQAGGNANGFQGRDQRRRLSQIVLLTLATVSCDPDDSSQTHHSAKTRAPVRIYKSRKK